MKECGAIRPHWMVLNRKWCNSTTLGVSKQGKNMQISYYSTWLVPCTSLPKTFSHISTNKHNHVMQIPCGSKSDYALLKHQNMHSHACPQPDRAFHYPSPFHLCRNPHASLNTLTPLQIMSTPCSHHFRNPFHPIIPCDSNPLCPCRELSAHSQSIITNFRLSTSCLQTSHMCFGLNKPHTCRSCPCHASTTSETHQFQLIYALPSHMCRSKIQSECWQPHSFL